VNDGRQDGLATTGEIKGSLERLRVAGVRLKDVI